MSNTTNGIWYPIAKIEAGAALAGEHVRHDWRENAGSYGMSLPVSVVSQIERIDWSRVTPAQIIAAVEAGSVVATARRSSGPSQRRGE